ncbi:MAG: nucleotidyltransferase family protein [Chloroflexi bacterium]|nr:nucleotidyltransferase family protein [Chloroflexota bacterium]
MSEISAIILAAGKSTRMGRQKMLMPWGETTVLGKVIRTIQSAGINDILLVANETIADSITNLQLPLTINNDGGMLASLQAGLQAVKPSAQAALVCLGDQPQIEEGSVRSVCEAFQKSGARLVAPSYQMRRGHPWLLERSLWSEILLMRNGSLREFLNAHTHEIEYVNVETPSILQDLDTPEDYLKYKPSL